MAQSAKAHLLAELTRFATMSDGTVGIGEGTTIGGLAYGAESPEGMKLAIDTYFAP